MAKNNLTTDFASFASDIFNVPLIQGMLRNLDTVLVTRGSGQGLRIYDDLERDPMVFATLQKRKMAVIGKPWKVQEASSSLRDRKAAEFVREQLDRMPFDKLCLDLLDALLKGFSVVEIIWQLKGEYLLPDIMLQRSAVRFSFDAERKLQLRVQQNPMQGIPVPERKFIVHSQGGKDGTPYGLGLGSKLYWPVLFKNQGIGFWLAFAERFGNPTVIGKYSFGTPPEEQAKLQKMMESIAQETVATIQEGQIIELLEPKSNTLTYEPLLQFADSQISIAVLGETMSTTASTTGLGGGSQAKVQDGVRKELSQADADLLSDTLNSTLIRWLVELNLPNAQPPRVYRDFSEPEDLNARAMRDKTLFEIGYKPTLNYVLETYGGEWEAITPVDPAPVADAVAQATAMLTGSAPRFTADQQAIEDRTDQALSGLVMGISDDDIKQAIRAATSADDLTERLSLLLREADTRSFETALSRALFAADVMGYAHAG